VAPFASAFPKRIDQHRSTALGCAATGHPAAAPEAFDAVGTVT
jgi:hypothetical protein